MYNKFANVTTPHCHFPASWLTFCTFAAAIASFKTSTLPDSMAFLSALAACTDHSSQYAFNIRNWLATGHFCLLVEKKDEEMYENCRLAQCSHFWQRTGNYRGSPPDQEDVLHIQNLICTQRTFAKTNKKFKELDHTLARKNDSPTQGAIFSIHAVQK